MKREEIVSCIHTFFHEVLANGNMEYFDEIFHEDYHRPPKELGSGSIQYWVNPDYRKQGKSGFREWLEHMNKSRIEGLMKLKHEIREIITEDSRAAVYYKLHVNIPKKPSREGVLPIPINKSVSFTMDASCFITFQDNKIIGLQFVMDTLTMAFELGNTVLDVPESEKLRLYFNKLKETGFLSV